ncbi:leucine-rich repeat domain-containing protein [Prevotella corporis]|uniref:leucine-rich repeat domain-containing protein n=1 Tax=Prevotella corporis TaxID=28128 RepID=UPI000408365B|nr:leucine-rich repeat domain-containing protein [Prevotella corporis]
MKQNYNNKKKHRSAWFALVLLMITALPITAQNAGDRFQVDNGYWYQVVDATAKTVKVTYASERATKPEAKRLELKSPEDVLTIEDALRGYNGTVPTTEKDEFVLKTDFLATTKEEERKHKINVVVIPETVKYNNIDWTVVAIGSYAFINERGVGNVELPETIEAIEDAAFYQCSVTMMNFPANLKYIGWRAFYKTNLSPYSFKESNKKKKKIAYVYYTKSNEPIKIPGSTAIGPQAFEGSFSTSKFECSNITFVGYQAFKGGKFDITTPIPATAKIGEQPDDNKIKAMYDNLPAGTDQRSGVESFTEFTGKVSLAEGPTTIPAGMFEKAFEYLNPFVIPSSVTSIGERAFAKTGIKSFQGLSAVKKIGARAFENCIQSSDILIGEQAEYIGDGAFAGNSYLPGFTLKGSANCKIGAGIFEGCPGLEYIDIRNMKQVSGNEDYLKNLSRAFNTDANPNKTFTAGLPTHTVVYLPDAADITFAAGQDVNFVKFDGTCTKLSLQDRAEYEFPYAIKASQAVYNKCNMTTKKVNIPRGYNNKPLDFYLYNEDNNSLTSYRDFSKFADGKHCFTIFLPYAVKLPDGIRAYKLDYQYNKDYFTYEPDLENFPDYPNGYPLDSGTEFYVFQPIKDGSTLDANRPYLLRITNANSDNSNSKAFTANNVEIAKSPTEKFETAGGRLKPIGFDATKPGQSFSFRGSTEKFPFEIYGEDYNRQPYVLSIAEKNTIEGKKEIDVWQQMKNGKPEGYPIPPFRGFVYLIPGTSGAKRFMVLSESKPTGISNATNDADAQQDVQRIYTMDGRYVGTNFDSLPSGIYIMKGKKTLKTK